MSYVGIDRVWYLNKKQWKWAIIGGVALLLSLLFLFWAMDLFGQEPEMKFLRGSFPMGINDHDVMMLENKAGGFDFFLILGDSEEMPDIRDAQCISGGSWINISRDISIQNGKLVIFFAFQDTRENVSWKYKGEKFIITFN